MEQAFCSDLGDSRARCVQTLGPRQPGELVERVKLMKRNNIHSNLRTMQLSIVTVILCAAPGWCSPNVELMLEQSPSDAGRITPGAGIHRFIPNTQIEISAIPQKGFQFAYWLGDVSDPTASTTKVSLNDSKAVIAVYEPMSPVPGENENIRMNGGGTGGGGGGGNGLRPSYADFFSVPFSAPGGSISGGQSATYQIIASEPVPEPTTLCILGLGSLALARSRRKRCLLI